MAKELNASDASRMHLAVPRQHRFMMVGGSAPCTFFPCSIGCTAATRTEEEPGAPRAAGCGGKPDRPHQVMAAPSGSSFQGAEGQTAHDVLLDEKRHHQ